MRIAINASPLLNKHKTGVELYTVRLLENLAKLDTKKFEFFVYYPDFGDIDNVLDLKTFPSNWYFKAVNWPLKYFWTQLALTKQLAKDKIDLLFVPAHVIPLLYKGKALMTVHDLAFKYFPETYSKKEVFYQDWAVKSAIKKNAKFIVPSRTTAEDLEKFYDVEKNRIFTIYHGFSGQNFDFRGDVSLEDLKKKYKFKSKYFISVGRVERKKNSLGMIKAFELFLTKYPYLKNEIDFLLIGKDGYGAEEVKNYYAQSKYKDNIHILGYLSSDEVNVLLMNAKAFLFTSFYEGFGFPILEALSKKVPVITSNYGVMKEIAENIAFLVDPLNLEEFSNAMYQALFNEEKKEKLLANAEKRLMQFNWEKTAKETLKAFETYV